MTVIICVTPSWQWWKSLFVGVQVSSGSSAALFIGCWFESSVETLPCVDLLFVSWINEQFHQLHQYTLNTPRTKAWQTVNLNRVLSPTAQLTVVQTQSLVMQSSMIQSSLSHFSSLLPHCQFQRWLVLKWLRYFWARWWCSLPYCCPLQLKGAPQGTWIITEPWQDALFVLLCVNLMFSIHPSIVTPVSWSCLLLNAWSLLIGQLTHAWPSTANNKRAAIPQQILSAKLAVRHTLCKCVTLWCSVRS